MSLKLVHLASEVEHSDDFHIARLLLLLNAASGKTDKPVEGIMKLAKMDFLLRYPNCLARVLVAQNKGKLADEISLEERNTIEAKMIRFRFGPWDKRYRRWIGVMASKGLVHAKLEGRTVKVGITPQGKQVADQLASREEFTSLKARSQLVSKSVGGYSATGLRDFMYLVFPEIVTMQWGQDINL